MTKLVIGELRGSWQAWLAVLATFIAANFALALSLLLLAIGLQHPWPDFDNWFEGPHLLIMTGSMNLVFSALTALAVIASAASLVIASRRASIARLSLAGASPGQVRATLMAQLAAASLAAALIGDVIAVGMLPGFLAAEGAERGWQSIPPATWDASNLVAANLLCVVIALVGGWMQVSKATRLSPVEALRDAAGVQTRRGPQALRWAATVLLAGVVLAGLGGMGAVATSEDSSVRELVLQGSVVQLLLTGLTLAVASPLAVGALTRVWTKLIPGGVTWHLARKTVIAKSDRLVKSVVPIMFTVGLTAGMLGVGATLTATIAAWNGIELEHTNMWSMLGLVGLPLVIAMGGAVSSLLMMGKQRDAELALDGIVGATPAQQVAIPVLEAVIVAVTGFLLGLVMTFAAILSIWIGFLGTPKGAVIAVPWVEFALIGGLTTLVTIAATTLPTLPSLRRPAPEVVARLIAA